MHTYHRVCVSTLCLRSTVSVYLNFSVDICSCQTRGNKTFIRLSERGLSHLSVRVSVSVSVSVPVPALTPVYDMTPVCYAYRRHTIKIYGMTPVADISPSL